jgi:hypothetical protein
MYDVICVCSYKASNIIGIIEFKASNMDLKYLVYKDLNKYIFLDLYILFKKFVTFFEGGESLTTF